jgi:hypothetical protein
MARETFLEQYRKQRKQSDKRFEFEIARFQLSYGRPSYSSGPTVPQKVKDRLNELQQTSRWKCEVDGYHVSFRQWDLAYHLGPRGGIQDVKIEADLNH